MPPRTAPGPVLYVAKVRAEPLPFALPPKDGELRWTEFQQQRMGPGIENEPYCKGLASSALMTGGVVSEFTGGVSRNARTSGRPP